MDPAFRVYHAFAAKYGVHPHATKIIVDYALNYMLNVRIGIPLSLIENRNDGFGSDKKELMSEADLIVTSAILWLYSPHKKTPMRGFLSKQYQLKQINQEGTSDYTDFICSINEVDKSVSIDDILILYVAISYMDCIAGFSSEIYYPEDFGEQNLKLVVESSCVSFCFLTSRKNIDGLLKEKVYRVCYMYDISQVMVSIADDYSLNYFSNTLSNSNSYLSNLRRIVNSVDKMPDEQEESELPSSSVENSSETRKRLSPSYEDPAYASFKEESSDETIEEDEEDHNYTSSLTKKLAKKRNINIEPANASKSKIDPFRRVGNALKEFTASNNIEMPVYRVGMKVGNVFIEKKQTVKPPPKPKEPSTRILTYAEMKRKQKDIANGVVSYDDPEYEDDKPKDKFFISENNLSYAEMKKLKDQKPVEEIVQEEEYNSEFEDLTPEKDNNSDIDEFSDITQENTQEKDSNSDFDEFSDITQESNNIQDDLSSENEITFDTMAYDTGDNIESSENSSEDSYEIELQSLEEDNISLHENGTCCHFSSSSFLN